jgi:hypothetical protein
VAKYNGKNELFGNLDAPSYQDKFGRMIKPITKADVDACIRKYLKKEGMVVSIVSSNPPSERQLRKVIDI